MGARLIERFPTARAYARADLTAMNSPISLIGDEQTHLPLQGGPFHVHITIPFSLLVRDFDPTIPLPQVAFRPKRSWMARLFGRRDATLSPENEAVLKALTLARPHLCDIWRRLSVLLFDGEPEEYPVHTYVSLDVNDGRTIGTSNLAWVVAAGDMAGDLEAARVLLLTAQDDPERGGIQFTWREMDDKDMGVLKSEWRDVRNARGRDGSAWSDFDEEMVRRHFTLNNLVRHGVPYRYPSYQRESLESSECSIDLKGRSRRRSLALWCFKGLDC